MKLRFTFCEQDHDQYGSGTWTFDPEAVLRQPTRELIAIEAATGMGVPALLALLERPDNRRYTEALLGATWVARRLAGITEPFDSYEPLVYLMAVEWGANDADPPAGTSSSSPQSEEG